MTWTWIFKENMRTWAETIELADLGKEKCNATKVISQ